MEQKKIETEKVYNKDFSVSDFLNPEIANSSDKEESGNDEERKEKSDPKKGKIGIAQKKEEYIENDYESIIDLDVYYSVLKNIQKALYIPRTKDDLIEILNVKQGQLNEWIKRAKQDGYIKKKNDKYGRLLLEKQTTFMKD